MHQPNAKLKRRSYQLECLENLQARDLDFLVSSMLMNYLQSVVVVVVAIKLLIYHTINLLDSHLIYLFYS